MQLGIANQAIELGAYLQAAARADMFERATPMAVSHTFDHGSGDAAKNAMDSRLKILSPIGLSSKLPIGKQV